jgi:hypothetical protein
VRSLVPDLHVVLAQPDLLVGGSHLPRLRHLWQGGHHWEGLRGDHIDLDYGLVKVQGLEVLLRLGWGNGAAELLQNVGVHKDGPRFEVGELLPMKADLRLNNA